MSTKHLDQSLALTSIDFIVTGRNEVVAKVMFLPPPPGPGRHHPPLDQADTPPDKADTHPPDQADTPPDQADTPQDQADPPPPPEADCSIRSMSGRYASHWNAFLLYIYLSKKNFFAFDILMIKFK